jgi:class 3 adenylate cyclase
VLNQNPVRYAESSGVAIAYQVVGNGERDLVLVPGFAWHLELIWEDPALVRFLERLSSFSRLILFDKRDQGLSDRTGVATALDESVADLLAVLDDARSAQATVLGVSEGGHTAIAAAVAHPDRVNALVLHGTAPRVIAADDYRHGAPPEALDRFLGRLLADWAGAGALELFAPSQAYHQPSRVFWGRLLRSASSPAAIRRVVGGYAEVDVRALVPQVQQSALVLARMDDELIPIEHARWTARNLPNAELLELPGSDHLPWAGDAGMALDEIEHFLTGERPAGGERVLATVLFTDLAGSTERAVAEGDEQWRKLLMAHDRIVDRTVVRHRGHVVKTIGDGVLAVFDGPARAIRAAHELRDRLEELELTMRAGVHTGECELIGADVGGLAVHIAARVAAAAQPGEVLVSRTVVDVMAGSPQPFADRGEHELRGVPGSWRLYAAGL